ncbi:MAG: lipid A deacylase LpxR family protein [Pseudomonadota bacterium]
MQPVQRFYLATIACLATVQVSAQGILNLLVENDVISGDDRHYTSGVALNYVSGLDQGPERLEALGIFLPGLERGDKMHVALSLGHEIYTPTDITKPDLISDDRPYAGHLYLGAGFITENSTEVETWRLSLGLVGPGARAEVIQNSLHRKIGSDEAQGWDNQLKNEVVLSLAYERKWLNLAREKIYDNGLSIDFIPHASAAIGTPTTYIGAGGMVRFGQGLDQDYGPPRVRPSLPVSQFYKPQTGASWYVFVGADTRYIAHNIFLDGNNFQNSHSVEREDFVSDLQAGFVWNHKRFRLVYNWVLRSREFKEQAERDLFSSLSVSIHI